MRTNYDGSNQNTSGDFDGWDSMFGGTQNRDIRGGYGADLDINDVFEGISRQQSEDSIFDDDSDTSIRGMLVKSYIAIESALNDGASYPPAVVYNDSDAVVSSPYDVNHIPRSAYPFEEDRVFPIADVAVQEVEKKRTNKPFLVSIIVGVLLLGIGGTVATMHYLNERGNVAISEDMSVDAVRDQVSALYSDGSKTDVKSGVSLRDVESLRIKVQALSALDSDSDTDIDISMCNDILDELDTVELYLKNSDKLSEYASSGCSYEREDIDDGLASVESDLRSYVVSGLKSTITNNLSTYKADRSTYFFFFFELLGIEDPMLYDENDYLPRINAVTHSTNRSYLQQIANKLLADKKTLELEKKYNEADDSEKERYKKELEEANSDKDRLASELEAEKKRQKETSSKEAERSRVEEKQPESPKPVESSVESKIESKVESKEDESPAESVVDETGSSEEITSSKTQFIDDGLVNSFVDNAKEYFNVGTSGSSSSIS